MDIDIPNYYLHKSNDDYMCLLPSKRISFVLKNSNLFGSPTRSNRFSTPSPPRLSVAKARSHKRSISWSVASQSNIVPFSDSSAGSNLDSRSETHSSGGSCNLEESISVHNCDPLFWLVLKVMPRQVEIYLHYRFITCYMYCL